MDWWFPVRSHWIYQCKHCSGLINSHCFRVVFVDSDREYEFQVPLVGNCATLSVIPGTTRICQEQSLKKYRKETSRRWDNHYFFCTMFHNTSNHYIITSTGVNMDEKVRPNPYAFPLPMVASQKGGLEPRCLTPHLTHRCWNFGFLPLHDGKTNHQNDTTNNAGGSKNRNHVNIFEKKEKLPHIKTVC